jgi:heptosyltransferase-1
MKSILIVRLGALGDIVHALPAAAALRDAFPEARIDWLVDARYRAVLDLVPVLDHRVSVDSRAWSGAKAPFTVIRELRRARYEIAFDLQGLIKSAALARLSGASRVVGYTTKHLREPAARLFYTEQVNPHVDEVEEEDDAEASGRGGYRAPALATVARARTTSVLHMVDRSVAALRAIGINRPELRFPLDEPPSPAPACTRQLLGLWPDEPFALINPGAAWPNKRWPAERFGALAREVRARHGLKSAVLWGPEEETLAAQVAAASDGAAEMAPLTSVADMIALARAARLLISGDTGPIHLAAAVGTAVVGIYGPTDPRRNGPWSPEDVCVSRFERCACHHQRRCRVAQVYRGAPAPPPGARWCLEDVTLNDVLDAVARRLARITPDTAS